MLSEHTSHFSGYFTCLYLKPTVTTRGRASLLSPFYRTGKVSPERSNMPWVSNTRLSQQEEQRCEPHQGPS